MYQTISAVSRRVVPAVLLLLLALSACEAELPTATPEAPATVTSPMIGMASSASELFISEYVEGSSFNKALEIYNGTGGPVDLTAGGYAIQMYFNGNTTPGLTVNLVGTVADGDVFVLAQSSADPAILAEADQTSGAGWFNGNDAVVLVRNGTVVDAIGQIGVDPVTEWGSGLVSTQDNTLRRSADVCQGDTDASNAFDPSVEWTGFATNTFDGLGSHAANCGAPSGPTELFFSEYVEGSSFNKALEIYNGTGTAVDLTAGGYAVQMYFNGNASASLTLALSGSVADGDVFVVALSSADPAILAQADQTNGASWFNGDDAVVLVRNGVVVDAIGQIGFDPGSEWGSGLTSTQDNTLRRNAYVCQGDADASNPFDPSVEWTGFAINTFDGLGAHTVACAGGEAAPAVVSVSPADGATDVAVDANILVTFSEAVSLAPGALSLTCSTSGSHVPGVSGGPVDWVFDPGDFAAGETCNATLLAAAVSDVDLLDPPDNLPADVIWSFTTGVPNVCGAPFTSIPVIQGSGAATPLAGTPVTTEGVVVGDYEGSSPALRGFYVQDPVGDGDPATSDGLFVFNAGSNVVSPGDHVRVTGTAQEFQDQTQIGSVSLVSVCAAGATVAPVDVTLPVPSPTWLERYEGMLVRLPQTLYVTEHFQLGRFGQVVLSADGRLPQPTSVAAPGAPALAVQAANDLKRLIVDDALNSQNPDPILFGSGGAPLSASNTLRGGDSATGMVGVLTYTWAGNSASGNAYRVRPVGALGGGVPAFAPTNPRPAGPPAVGGSLRVGAFNVLNYFNTFGGACTGGAGGAPTDCRGADDAAEFERQAQKIVSAIVGLDADVLGLIEIENDGYGAASAIADLVGRLNGVAGAGTYAFVDADAATGQVNALGTDAIKVGLIFKPASVTPVGSTAVLNSEAFINGGDGAPRNRASLAQAFETTDGGVFIANVNHFKSKGSGCSVPDAGDGQGQCNAVRVVAATLLGEWLAADPTGTGDPDVLILGDLNSYAQEDPVQALVAAGYGNLLASFEGPDAYGYAFDGQWGYLDHALGSSTLGSQASGAATWHINADEPSVLDYNTNFKSPGQQVSLYEPTGFRSSDHDPVVVGLDLTPELRYDFQGFLPPVANLPEVNRDRAGRNVPLKFSLGGDQGLDIFEAGYPRSVQVTCSTWGDMGDPGEATVNPGNSALSYHAGSGTYSYNWKTSREWSGQCRELVVRFRDRSEARLRFDFR